MQMMFGSSHWRCSVRKGVLRNFVNFTEKQLCRSLFFNKSKKRLWHGRFSVNFAKFLRTPFLQNTVQILLDVFVLSTPPEPAHSFRGYMSSKHKFARLFSLSCISRSISETRFKNNILKNDVLHFKSYF